MKGRLRRPLFWRPAPGAARSPRRKYASAASRAGNAKLPGGTPNVTRRSCRMAYDAFAASNALGYPEHDDFASISAILEEDGSDALQLDVKEAEKDAEQPRRLV